MKVLIEFEGKKYWSYPEIDGESDGFFVDVFNIESLEIEFKPNVFTNCDDRIEEFEGQILENINIPAMRAA